jgi:hypothetical protein
MSQWPLWAVLAPGDLARLERRARAIAMADGGEEDGGEPPFKVIHPRGFSRRWAYPRSGS